MGGMQRLAPRIDRQAEKKKEELPSDRLWNAGTRPLRGKIYNAVCMLCRRAHYRVVATYLAIS